LLSQLRPRIPLLFAQYEFTQNIAAIFDNLRERKGLSRHFSDFMTDFGLKIYANLLVKEYKNCPSMPCVIRAMTVI
jgi:hypothetical protein